jgi:hypothetical protein
MKRRVAFILVPIMAAMVVLVGTVAPAYADSLYRWGTICHNTTNQCMNQTAGQKGSGVQFWAHTKLGNANNEWNFWQVAGTPSVNCASGYPWGGTLYVPESLCNSWGYNGNPVLKIAWAPSGTGSGYCIWAGDYDGSDDSPIGTSQCSPSGSPYNTYLYVLTNSGFLVSAYATTFNFLSGGIRKRAYLGTCDYVSNSDGNGEPVCLTYNHGIGWKFLDPA